MASHLRLLALLRLLSLLCHIDFGMGQGCTLSANRLLKKAILHFERVKVGPYSSITILN